MLPIAAFSCLLSDLKYPIHHTSYIIAHPFPCYAILVYHQRFKPLDFVFHQGLCDGVFITSFAYSKTPFFFFLPAFSAHSCYQLLQVRFPGKVSEMKISMHGGLFRNALENHARRRKEKEGEWGRGRG